MKKSLYMLFMLTGTLGCSTIRMQQHQKNYAHLPLNCQEQIKRVKDNFFYDTKYNHYVLNGSSRVLEELFDRKWLDGSNVFSKSCYSYLNEAEICDIFGKPSVETNKGLYYFLDNKSNSARYVLLFFKDKPRVFIGQTAIE